MGALVAWILQEQTLRWDVWHAGYLLAITANGSEEEESKIGRVKWNCMQTNRASAKCTGGLEHTWPIRVVSVQEKWPDFSTTACISP